MSTYTSCVAFEEGYFKITSTEESITHLSFEDEKSEPSVVIPPIIERAKNQLKAYLTGKTDAFDLKLEPTGTDFQKRVWTELQKIPFGKTISYLDLAKKLGDEKVIRAAASANGKNPIPLIIPCHRVIGQNGKLVGFSGGLHRKKWLLDHENKHANGVLTLF